MVKVHSLIQMKVSSKTKLSLLFNCLSLWIAKVGTMSAMTMRAADFVPGGPENITIKEVPIPELREKEVLMKVYATAINRADTLQRKGKYPPPTGESTILGLEAAGKIEKLGPGCSGKWKVGDRVMSLLSGGGNAEYVAAFEDHLMPVSKEMSFNVAASIPEVWLTAYQILHTVGHMKASEKVLIHAGGSGVGTAATQLVKLVGSSPIVTAGSEKKIQTAKDLGAVAGFNYKEGDFTEKVLAATDGKGVDLILDCVGSSFWKQNAGSLAMEGRWVLYGLLSGPHVDGDILATILRKRAQILGTTLRTRSKEYKTDLIRNFTENALPHLVSGKMKTVIDRTYPLEKLSQAHKDMEDNINTGKLVIQVRDEGNEGDHMEL